MSEFRVKAINKLHAEFSVPGDKSMSHRAAILGGLSNGTCTVRNFLPSEDCVNTLNAMQALGARHEVLDELPGYGPVNLHIHGQSMKLTAPAAPIASAWSQRLAAESAATNSTAFPSTISARQGTAASSALAAAALSTSTR
jgi:5-enolpyruvylshikimate-3-phosphate synthase